MNFLDEISTSAKTRNFTGFQARFKILLT
jgi:hypothetical protein